MLLRTYLSRLKPLSFHRGRRSAHQADLLKVADKTVYTMAQKGQLPAFKVRGQWRFKREDIDAWIEQQKQSHAEKPG
ncbi:MAG: helix-turn-helix domain-containing protein [Rhodoplanes sp.]